MGSLKNLTTTDAYATRVIFRLQIGVFSVSAELNRYLQSACDQGQDKRKKGDGEPLEIDGGGGQVGLDFHIGQASPYSACQSMPCLGFAVEPFGTPPVASVKSA